jgi:hypothetical protein
MNSLMSTTVLFWKCASYYVGRVRLSADIGRKNVPDGPRPRDWPHHHERKQLRCFENQGHRRYGLRLSQGRDTCHRKWIC